MAFGPGRFESLAYNALRIVAGLLFMLHGLSKFGFYGGNVVDNMTLRGAAAVIETIGGPLIVVGLFTVPSAFIASGEMAFAYFLSHCSASSSCLSQCAARTA